ARARKTAALRGDVLDQIAPCGRQRDHRQDLPRPSRETRLWFGRLGLVDPLSREALMRAGLLFFLLALFTAAAMSQSSQPYTPVDPDASAVKEQRLLEQEARIQ